MRNIKITVEYDGTGFSGWQIQKDRRTVQEEITLSLRKILKEDVNIFGSGRTDAGVHALGQVANFYTDKSIQTEELLYALNTMLPPDIVVLKVEDVAEEFNARISGKKKHYRYVVNNGRFPSALNVNREYHFKYNLDIEKMKEAAKYLEGTHDFKAFCATGSKVEDTVRTIYVVSVNKLGDRVIIDVVGNGFLYNMVRIIVGTLLDCGTGKIKPDVINKMIETKDRSLGGRTVGPEGLYLANVEY